MVQRVQARAQSILDQHVFHTDLQFLYSPSQIALATLSMSLDQSPDAAMTYAVVMRI